MYYIRKRMEIAGCHHLNLPYESKCSHLHGHNWIVTIYCKAKELDSNGMLVDFGQVKELIHGYLDHQDLNEKLDFNPTAENIAKWIVDRVPHCYRAEVQESSDNLAVYEIDE